MPKKESFLKSILQYSVSTWANFFIGIVSVVLMTRLLSPDLYGLVAIFYSASSVALYALTLGLDGAYIRFYNEPPANDSKQQLLYKIITISVFVCIVTGTAVTILGGDLFSSLVFGIGGKILCGFFFVYVFCQILLRYLNISFRMSFRVWHYNLQNIMINCLSKLLVIIAAFFTDNFVYIAALLSIGLFTVLLLYLFLQRREFIPYNREGKFDRKLSFIGYHEYFRFALFSAPAYVVHYLNIYVNQQIILTMMSAYALGIFSSSGLFGSILVTIRGGFSIFWSAYVFQNYEDDQQRIGKMHDFVMIFAILAVSVVILLRDVIYLFIGQEYHESKIFFSLLLAMPVFSFVAVTTSQGIAISKKNHLDLFADVVSVVFNIIFCLLLIPAFELIGAALANAISAIALFLVSTYFGQKYYKTIFNLKKSIIGFSMLILILLVPSITVNMIYIVISILCINALSIALYRVELKYSLSLFSTKMKIIN